ncbi:MAG: YraN family protein [Pseudomonadota bacterium]
MSRSRQKAERAGRRAEWLAALYLQLKGYRVLERRYRSPYGEIDLITRRRKTLVFVEVKQRRRVVDGLDPLTAQSEERILRTGEAYLTRHSRYIENDFALRYDLIVVTGRFSIDHRRDVFRGW